MSESDTTVVSKDKNGDAKEVQDTKVSEKDSSADIKVGCSLIFVRQHDVVLWCVV